MHVRVAVEPAAERPPQTEGTEGDEQRPTENFPSLLDRQRQRPAEHDQRRGTGAEQQCMTEGEPNGNRERPRPLYRRPAFNRRDRQRRNPHQVIGTKAVEETERQRRQQEHGLMLLVKGKGRREKGK